jgi:hypothetical protein
MKRKCNPAGSKMRKLQMKKPCIEQGFSKNITAIYIHGYGELL